MGIKDIFWVSIGCILLLPVVGCSSGSTGTVNGVVKVDGEPATGLEVKFTPLGHQASVALGTTQEGGRFTLFQGRGNSGISIGDYKVSVTGSPDSVNDKFAKTIAKQFKTPNETPLTEKVVVGSNMLVIELTSK